MPKMLPNIAPRMDGEMPCEVLAAGVAVGIAEVDETKLEVDWDADVGANVEDDVEGAEVMAELTEDVNVVGVAEVEEEVVDGGGVNPPYVHTPLVPKGICSAM